jgi:hypothetical protein
LRWLIDRLWSTAYKDDDLAGDDPA